ncbi:MAG: cytochrome b5 domain-containing protein [Burkholderiales bacterium]|nr:cytochrome b5 domain-containing protein [Burkholderiales bacterium]
MKKTLFLLICSFNLAYASTLPVFNQKLLSSYDGQNGHQSYVALNGYVYDVSSIDEWDGGRHYKGMKAGTDLTPFISQSPHKAKIIQQLNLKPIGTYKN